ncbi:winged helix-turn-helix domain-containing protein [Streptomyces sp. E11-3]|uniref:winged helix-turn-helix domain-containing protein n=1 Tax=Streptomyces sp. E11-3 TaxID=3110112 RepID=UPI00398012B3
MNGSKPSYPEIADELRDRIQRGVLPAGSKLPTQARLAQEFGVERGTVRQAMRVLQDEGLLINVTKGSPPQVAAAPAPEPATEEPQPTMVALGPRLAEAFAAPAVRVDALCLTAENLMLALGEPLRLIHEGRVRPESVNVRVLLPSSRIALAFPTAAEQPDDDDDPVHSRWLAQRNAQGQVLRHNLLALRASHDIDVQVTFRALPFTPPVKLYLLNGSEALFAYYMVARREEELDSGTLDLYDALGTRSLLFSFEKGQAHRDESFVQESQKWFDALWNTITRDLTLS